jgi:nucleotide-binding universal stress UspA family protein
MFPKILVAIDDSEFSCTIFEQALALAKTHHSELMIMHVLSLSDDIYPGDPYVGIPHAAFQVYAKRWEDRKQTSLIKLRALEEEAAAIGVLAEFTQNAGDPGKLICDLAKSWDANLIVIGRRGLSGLSELFMGSVSNYVLHHAPCHVLTIQGVAQTVPPLETARTVSGAV